MEPAADTAVRNLSNVYEGLELEDSHDSIMQEGNDEGQEQDATPVAPLPGDLLRNEFAFQHGCDGNSMQGSLQADPSTSSLAWRATGSPPYGSVHIGAPSVSGSSQAWDLAPSVAAQAEAALGERTFVRSNELKDGLYSGDVIVLLQQGTPFTVVHAQLPGLPTNAPQYILEPAAADLEPLPGSSGMPPELGPAYDPRCFLEVVRQGEYVGLRSAAAGFRFLQPRRKAPNRLVFFNLNLGIWEQWELVGGEPSHPWVQTPLLLRHRRLPHVQLSVEAARIGSYTTGPLLFGTPRSLRPTAGAGIRALARAGVPGGSAWDAAAAPSAAGSWRPGSMAGAPSMAGSVAGSQGPVLPGFLAELGEDENLRRISAAMLAEWFRFVDSEKAVRLRVEDDVMQANAELSALRDDTIVQISDLRTEMNTEIVTLYNVVRAREAQLAAARAARRRALTAAVAALWRRRAVDVSRAVLEAWGAWAATRATHRALVVRGVTRTSQRRLAAMFRAWGAAAARTARLATLLVMALMAGSRRRLGGAFGGWLHVARCCAAGRAKLGAIACGAERRALAAAFGGWQDVRASVASARVRAESLYTRKQMLLQAQVFTAWQEGMAASRSDSLRGLHAAVRHERRLQWRALCGWADVTEEVRVQRALAAALAARHAERLQLAALTSWSSATKRAAVCEKKAAAFASKQRVERASAVLWAWHDTARVKRWECSRVARAQAKRRAALLATCMQQLRDVATKKRQVARMLARRATATRSAVLRAWQAACVQAHTFHGALAATARRAMLQRVHLAVQQWLQLSLARTQRRTERVAGLPALTRAAFAVGLGALVGALSDGPCSIETCGAEANGVLASPPRSPLAPGGQAAGITDSPGSSSKKQKPRKKHKKRAQAAVAAAAVAGSSQQAGGSGIEGDAAGNSSDCGDAGWSPLPPHIPFMSHMAPPTPGSTGSTGSSTGSSAQGSVPGSPGLHAQPGGTPTSKLSVAGEGWQPSRFAAEAGSQGAAAHAGGSGAHEPPSFVPGTPTASVPGSSVGAVSTRAVLPPSPGGAAEGSAGSVGSAPSAASFQLPNLAAAASEDGSLSAWLGSTGSQAPGASGSVAAAAPLGRTRGLNQSGTAGCGVQMAPDGQAQSDTDTVTSPDLAATTTGRLLWLLHATFHAWRAASAQLATQAKVLGAQRSKVEQRVMSRALSAWSQQVRAKQFACSAAAAMAARRARSQQQQVLVAWADLTAASHAVRAHVAQRVAIKDLQLQRAVMGAWWEVVGVSQAVNGKAEAMGQNRQVQVQRTAMAAWAAFVDMRHARAAKLARSIMRMSNRRMALVLRAWADMTQRSQALAATATTRMGTLRMRQVLHAWSGVVTEECQERGGVERAEQRAAAWARATRCRQVLGALAAHVQRAQGLRLKVARGLMRSSTGRLRCAFGAWREHVCWEQALCKQGEVLARRRAAAVLRAVFGAWVVACGTSRAALAAAEAMAAKCSRRQLRAALQGWAQTVGCFRTGRALLEQAAGKRERGIMAGVFSAWWGAAQDAAARREAAQRMSDGRTRLLVAAVFHGWAATCLDDFVFSCWGMEAEKVPAAGVGISAGPEDGADQEDVSDVAGAGALDKNQVAESGGAARCSNAARGPRFESAYSMRLGSGYGPRFGTAMAFGGAAVPLAVQLVLQARRRAAMRTLRAAFHAWGAHVEARRQATSAAALADAKRTKFLAKAVLRNWSLLAAFTKVQRLAVERMAGRTRRRTLQRLLRHWHVVTAQSRQRMEALKACIKRKHVAFQLFKAWYWDAFDHDVQQTIATIFHNTDAAATSPVPSHHTAGSSGAAFGAGFSSPPQQAYPRAPHSMQANLSVGNLSVHTNSRGGAPMHLGSAGPPSMGIGSHWSAAASVAGRVPATAGLRAAGINSSMGTLGGSSGTMVGSNGVVGGNNKALYGAAGLAAGAGGASFRAWASLGSQGAASSGTVGGGASLGAAAAGVPYAEQPERMSPYLGYEHLGAASHSPGSQNGGSPGFLPAAGAVAVAAATAAATAATAWPQRLSGAASPNAGSRTAPGLLLGPRNTSSFGGAPLGVVQYGGSTGGAAPGARAISGGGGAGAVSVSNGGGGGGPSWRTVAQNNLFVESLYENSLFMEEEGGAGLEQDAQGGARVADGAPDTKDTEEQPVERSARARPQGAIAGGGAGVGAAAVPAAERQPLRLGPSNVLYSDESEEEEEEGYSGGGAVGWGVGSAAGSGRGVSGAGVGGPVAGIPVQVVAALPRSAQPLRGLAAAATQRAVLGVAAAGGGSLGAVGHVSQSGAGDVAAQWQQQQFVSMGSAALQAALRDGEP